MEILKIALGHRQENPQRKERLAKIRRAIEASVKYEEEAMSKPLNASTLKRIYNLDSLWIQADEDIRKLGSANYKREMNIFNDIRERYGDIESMRVERNGRKYHAVESGGKLYLFSTSLEFTNNDVAMILREIEDSLKKKKLFLSSETNIGGE